MSKVEILRDADGRLTQTCQIRVNKYGCKETKVGSLDCILHCPYNELTQEDIDTGLGNLKTIKCSQSEIVDKAPGEQININL